MRITKYVHSCLLVETDDSNILIDPGLFTWDSHLLNPNHLPQLTHIIITHDHVDHYCEPALRAITQRFGQAKIITNNDLAKKIKELNLPNHIQSGSEDNITTFEAPHAPLPLDLPAPLNIGVHIDDKLTHSGDALDFSLSREILALPLTGPFCSMTDSLKQAVKLKAKVLLPVHDWHWHQKARESMYDMAKGLLKQKGIEFIELKNGEAVEF